MAGKRARGRRDETTKKESRVLRGEVEALRIGSGGLAVRVGKKRFAVAAGVPGDKVRIRPRPLPPEARRAVMKGELPLADVQRVDAPGPDRVDPPCVLLSRCGGCAIQELSYAGQLEQKGEALRALGRRLGVAEQVEAAARVSALSSPFGYRTKLTMPAAGRPGALRFGFYGRGNFDPIAAEGCPVQHPMTLVTLARARQALDGFEVDPTKRGRRDGWLHGLAIRVDPPSGACELTLIGRDDHLPGGEALVKTLAALPDLQSLYLSINAQRSSYLLGDDLVHLAGARRTRFNLAGMTLSLLPGSFLQTSHEGAELLVARVLASLPERFESLVDLYGGVGVFARASAGRWRRARVVEANEHAVADLRRALRRDQAPKLEVIAGRVEDQLARALRPRPEVVIVDPPRRGCHADVVEALVDVRPTRLVYVACGADTFERDAARLIAGGFTLTSLEGIDMFPHTTHLEIIASFR